MNFSEQQLGKLINEQLNHMLGELRDLLYKFTLDQTGEYGNEPERYLLEVNTFYYQTFSAKYFPVFRQNLQADISHLLNLSQDETSLKADIMANIQRYARLYNQVKTIHALLTVTREDSQLKILGVTRDRNQQLVDLLYALKTLQDQFQLFNNSLYTIQEFLQDEELVRLARLYPDHIIMLEQVIRLDFQQPSVAQGFNQLLGHLHHSRNMLRELANSPWNQTIARETISNMVSATERVINRQAPQPLRSFYEQQFKRQYLMYTLLMEADIDRQMVDRVQEMARQFDAWMERLVIVLDRGVRFASRHGTELLHSAHYLSGLSSSLIDRLQKDARGVAQDIQQLVSDLSSSEEADAVYFLDRSARVVESSLSRLQPYTDASWLRLPPLNLQLERSFLELSFLHAQIQLLKEKQHHASQILEQYLQVRNMVQSYLDLLANIKADLERILAPRNINRFWKNHGVRVERVSLEKGHAFPEEYLPGLDGNQIEVRYGNYEVPTILFEEGDLFIIRVDQSVAIEVPRLIIGRRD